LSKLADVGSITRLHSLVHQITVNVDGVRVEPGNLLAVSKGSEHVVGVVPLETVDHVADLVELRGVNLSHKHITVAIDEAHLALSSDFNLVQLHLDDVGSMFNRLSSLAGVDVKHSHGLGVAGVNQSNNVGGH